MDAIDEEILGLLRNNARVSFTDLARKVGLSTSAATARVRRLERDQVILGYTLRDGEDLPWRRSGLEVFIDLRLEPGVDGEAFRARIAAVDQVVDAVHVTGPFDYLLRAWVADTAALDRLLRRLKKECGAVQTQTRVALR